MSQLPGVVEAALPPSGGDLLTPPSVDFTALRAYRLERIRKQLAAAQVDLAVLTSPLSLQYAVDFDEYQLFQSRIPSATLLVPAEGPVTFCGAYHRNCAFVDEYLPTRGLTHFDSGLDIADRAREFADFLRGRSKGRSRIAVERLDSSVVQALMQVGFDVGDAGGLMEGARAIKSAEEVSLIRHAIAVAELGMARMQAALRPGITENQLWAILHYVNVAHGGRWTDGRMLASGPRTNPWFQEASDRAVQAGELVGLDTDMIGPFGYFADVSRTWLCGDGPPSAAQKDRYRRAHDEVHHNMGLIRPGLAFREFAQTAFRQPPEFTARRYMCLSHGAGMSDEWPKIAHRQDWADSGYEGVIETGMVLCVESYVGSESGGEGVKLEQQVLVTEAGCEPLSHYPFEAALLS